MNDFLNQLGIDWRLLLSQALNFFLLFLILRSFVYKPVVKILKERRKKIEEGLENAEKAKKRLEGISRLAKEKMKETENKALQILKQAEKKGKKNEAAILSQAREKEKNIFKSAEAALTNIKNEERQKLAKEATEIVKAALVKTVELAPEKIDEALLKKAVAETIKET